jgi:hypothetical protein
MVCVYASSSGYRKAISCGCRIAYDMLETNRRIAAQLSKIQPYKPGKAA